MSKKNKQIIEKLKTKKNFKKKNSAGGAATTAGIDFQHRVAAWVAVHILAEKDVAPLWELPSDTTLEWLQCEAEQPVDDLIIGTSTRELIYCQIKRNVNLSRGENSPLASALDQFVRQFIVNSYKSIEEQALSRFILIVSQDTSRNISVHLKNVLNKVRRLIPCQTLDKAPTNKDERDALSIIQSHLVKSWKKIKGEKPSEGEFRHLLSLIYIDVIDVEPGGLHEREAKTLLRGSVLKNPDQDELAWTKLIEVCTDRAKLRSGIDRLSFQTELLSAGISIKAVRSYREDIEKLQKRSLETAKSLARFAEIRLGSLSIHIKRPYVDALKQIAEKKSVLVIGEPGAGKTGVLYNFVKTLIEEKRDFVFLVVSDISAQSLDELRLHLNLEHDLIDILNNWPGEESAFLVIDALDAAREAGVERTIRELIRKVIERNGRWRVVASIRKFDLRYGEEIKELFIGEPPTEFKDPEFSNICHINTSSLSDKEIEQLTSQAPDFAELFRIASEDLRKILRNPFNLQLMANLLSKGISVEELSSIKTQIELLDQYWRYRVLDKYPDERETLLEKACEVMIKSRTLRVNRREIVEPSYRICLKDLLRNQVLVEWQPSPNVLPERYILSFSHHILFDYAVARLLFRGTPQRIIHQLRNDLELVLIARPSLVFHFHYLWNKQEDRKEFWEVVFKIIEADGIPEIGKLIGPSVAAELTQTLSDLEPLCNALEDSSLDRRKSAEQALRHLVGDLLTKVSDRKPLIGPEAGPWCEFLERISKSLRNSVAYSIGNILVPILENPQKLTPTQRILIGQVARRLFEFAWSRGERDRWLVTSAIKFVCRTFESNPKASAELLKRCLESFHFKKYGYEELPHLTQEIRWILDSDPEFVEEIYRTAFSYQEESQELTLLIPSSIFGLTSTRKQDYESGLFNLAEIFPQFLKQAPKHAIRALISVLEAYVRHYERVKINQIHEETFDFNGSQARIVSDRSRYWDEGELHKYENPIKMLNSFQAYLEELANHEEIEKLRRIIGIIISQNRLAILWSRLLLAGSKFPSTLGKEILPLSWAIPILKCADTIYPVGIFLQKIYPYLKPAQKKRIEQAILSLPEIISEDQQVGEHIRNRLLGCLPEHEITTGEARHFLKSLRAKNLIPPNEPPIKFLGVEYTEEDTFQENGVPIDEKPNKRIHELKQPVKEFAEKYLNSTPSSKAIEEIFPSIQVLYEALIQAKEEEVHPKLYEYAWDDLVSACERIARINKLSCTDKIGALIKKILLEASKHPNPSPDPEFDAQFSKSPGWGKPAPRIEATSGLIWLARHPTCATSDVSKAIERLSKDPVPAVRFHIARFVNLLYRTAPNLMWKIIDQMSHEEPNQVVLQGLLTGALASLARVVPNQVVSLVKIVKTIFNRFQEEPEAYEVRKSCINIFTDLYISRNHKHCKEIVWAAIKNLPSTAEEVSWIPPYLRNILTYGPISPVDPAKDAIRHRAFELLKKLLCSAHEKLKLIESQYNEIPFNKWPEAERKNAKLLVEILNSIADQIYFASGAFDEKQKDESRKRQVLTPAQKERFYREVGPILDKLAEIGLPKITHHLLETLEVFIPFDPKGVFLRIGQIIRQGESFGYQYESLAANLIVKLVSRYIADYPYIFKDFSECRQTLLEVLDIFVRAGWPAARRLVYRLDEIFR